jgi:hypothetical protein
MAASAVIGSLRVNLGIDTAAFTKGLSGVQGSLDRVGKTLQQWGGKMSTYVTAPLAGAGVAVTAAMSGMARDVEGLTKAAQLSDAGFESFQRLAFAAETVGIESAKLADIYKDVNDKVGDFMATGGGPMKDFFENIAPKIGLTAEAFKNLSGPQSLQLYYDSLAKAGASQQDMTFYMEAIANDATALIPLLRDGGKAFEELGAKAAVLSEADATGLRGYNEAMRDFGESMQRLTIAVAKSGLVETLTSVVNTVSDWITTLSNANPELVKWGGIVAGVFAVGGPLLVGLGLFASALTLISWPVVLVAGGIGLLAAAVIKFWPEIEKAGAAISTFVSGAWAKFEAAWDGMVAKVHAVKDSIVAFAASIPGVFANLAGQMAEIGGQIIDGLWQGLKAKWESVKGWVTGVANWIPDIFRKETDTHSPSRVMHAIGVDIMEGLRLGMDSVGGAIETTATGTADTVAGVFESLGGALAGFLDKTKSTSEKLRDLFKTLVNSIFSMMGNGGGVLGGLFKGIVGGILGSRGGASFDVGGFSAIDSSLSAFKTAPTSAGAVSRAGQRAGGGVSDVRVWVDQDGNWQAAVERIAQGPATRAAAKAVSAIPSVSEKTRNDGWRKLRPQTAGAY